MCDGYKLSNYSKGATEQILLQRLCQSCAIISHLLTEFCVVDLLVCV